MTSSSRIRSDSHQAKVARSDSIDIPIERITLSPKSTSTDRIQIETPTKLSPQNSTDKSESRKSANNYRSWSSSMHRMQSTFNPQNDLLKWLDELSEESDDDYPWRQDFKTRSPTHEYRSYEYRKHKPLQESIDMKGFGSEDIKVTMNGRQIEIMAEKESQTNGVRRSQKIFEEIIVPDTVDEDQMKCYLTPDNTLMLEAPCKENLKRQDSSDSLNKEITVKIDGNKSRSSVVFVHLDQSDPYPGYEVPAKIYSSTLNNGYNGHNHGNKNSRPVHPIHS